MKFFPIMPINHFVFGSFVHSLLLAFFGVDAGWWLRSLFLLLLLFSTIIVIVRSISLLFIVVAIIVVVIVIIVDLDNAQIVLEGQGHQIVFDLICDLLLVVHIAIIIFVFILGVVSGFVGVLVFEEIEE